MGAQWKLFENFGRLSLEHPEAGIDQLLTFFVNRQKEEDVQFIQEYFPVFVKCGYVVREAPETVKKEIIQEGKKRN